MGKPTGRNERERMSQDYRSLDATPFRATELTGNGNFSRDETVDSEI